MNCPACKDYVREVNDLKDRLDQCNRKYIRLKANYDKLYAELIELQDTLFVEV